MNFFEHQDRAKRKTKQLILLLAAAVISLVVITTMLFAVVLYLSGTSTAQHEQPPGSFWNGVLHALSPDTFLWIALGVTSVVLLGSLFRFMQLGSGGRAVAEAMGGQLLMGGSTDLDERKILNVVEEMAIASGTAVPPVYLIEDNAINAFAAGYHPQDAVIGITRGCIQQLTRDELQGVVAHEFSHIFHGDMRINMRLIALLYGILVIGLIGEFLIRISNNRGVVRSSKDKSPIGILALGVGLLVIGYTGTFFGNIIKAAVSRQREFLADASAVQFTRNPDGIGGALKKIGGSTQGSHLHSEQAAEFSHMYFSQGVELFFNMMATHPPLEDRIKRIQPNWDGDFNFTQRDTNNTAPIKDTYKGSKTSAVSALAGFTPTILPAIDIETTLNQIAQPTAAQINYAQDCLHTISASLKNATQTAYSARAVVFGLLLDRHLDQRNQQLALLSEYISPEELQNLNLIIHEAAQAKTHLRLPLIELCIVSLKQLSAGQYTAFMQCLHVLISADQKISLMEWAIYRIVLHNTQPAARAKRSHPIKDFHHQCQLLLSLLAYAGARTEADANNAFVQASAALPFANFTLLARAKINLSDMDAALELLNQIKPLQKPQLLKAMSLCVLHDGKINIAEAELFRALADSLDCPIPPQINLTLNTNQQVDKFTAS